MLDRLQTLATESASQTFTGNRATLNNEYQGLLTEIDRQANNVGLGDQNAANATDLQVFIGGGQSSDANSSVAVNLSNQSASATGLGLAGTSVLTTAAVPLGTVAATAIQAGNTDSFTVNTAAGSQLITIPGETGDTVQGQVNALNAQLNVLGISASLNQSGILQFQSSNAFSVSAIANNQNASGIGDLVDTTADAALNTGLNNIQYTSATAGDVLTITVGSNHTAAITIAGLATQDMATQINQALRTAGITGVSAVVDATDGTSIDLLGASTFTNTFVSGGGALGATPTAAVAGGDPNAAINAITQAVESLGTVQGIVGAGENTLNYAINLAQSQITSFSAAQSQIRDANVAAEAANLTKAQVLQQASIAAMAQANQEPQAVLALLKQ
jgi:flagellin